MRKVDLVWSHATLAAQYLYYPKHAVLQVLYHSLHDDGAAHAATITDATQADSARFWCSQCSYTVCVPSPAVPVA